MIWQLAALVTFGFVISAADITCYSNWTGTATSDSCSSYCQLTYSSDSVEASQMCSVEFDTYGGVECEILDAVNKCVQTSSFTYTNYSVTCDSNDNAVITSQSSTISGKMQCCNTDDCNTAFSTCTTSTTATSVVQSNINCDAMTYTDYSSYYDYLCGNSSAFYTTSICNIAAVDVISSKCDCEYVADLYVAANATQKTSLAGVYNLSTSAALYDSCWIQTNCSWDGTFTYTIVSYSFSFMVSFTGLSTASYTPSVIITALESSLSLAGVTISSTEQIYIKTASIPTVSTGTSTITFVLQFSTMSDASAAQTTINGTSSLTVSAFSGTVSGTSAVSTDTYTYSESDGNMNKFIGISLLIAVIGLLFN